MSVRKKHYLALYLLGPVVLSGAVFADAPPAQNNPVGAKPASAITVERNAKVFQELDFHNQEEYNLAMKGFISAPPKGTIIRDKKQQVVWDFSDYAFENTARPETAKQYQSFSVNPSLWRQAQLNNNVGLFKVTEKHDDEANIYQIRGFDLANMTIIEGKTGIIVLDVLTSKETAQAAIEFYVQQRGSKRYPNTPPGKIVRAVIYSHSHIDHFGGAEGVVSMGDAQSGAVAVIAPQGFLDAAVSENVYVGNAMGRRAGYMYGTPLLMQPAAGQEPRGGGEQGQVDAGLGKAVSSGTATIIAPTITISSDAPSNAEALNKPPYLIDEVSMEYQLTPKTEAPSEMTVYFPDFKALNTAEIACPLQHNLLTMRGSEVRDALAWAHYLTQTLDRYGNKTEVMLGQHNWPRWGAENMQEVLATQRDSYKYIHDQSLRLTNQGYTMNELAEMVVLPDSLKKPWYNQGYYGALKHNVKAVYQKYMGWYDANPAHLNPLSDTAASKKYIQYMGGLDAVMAKAKDDFKNGEYRWVAQVMNHAVFAFPDNKDAAGLQADALEQLGYQAEASTWRNAYIMGANELRNGIKTSSGGTGLSMYESMTMPMYFDNLGISLNGPKADGKNITIKWVVECGTEQPAPDMCGNYITVLEKSALTYLPQTEFAILYKQAEPKVSVTVTLKRDSLDWISDVQASAVNPATAPTDTALKKVIENRKLHVEGDKKSLLEFISLLDTFTPDFPIVTPQLPQTDTTDRNR